MKKTICLFMMLCCTFLITWNVKVRAAINKPDKIFPENEAPWYETRYSTPVTSDDWILNPEIPVNYVPVPGEDELYMVISDSGDILNYRRRTKQIDGSWAWEDILNPELPIDITPVDGIDDLYKVIDENDIISYQKYIRNIDNSYAFVESDDKGRALDNGTSAEEITDNYLHYNDNIYALYNENNVLIGYRERVQDENGGYFWYEIGSPSSQDMGITSLSEVLQENTSDLADPVLNNPPAQQISDEDGSYSVTKTSTNTITENGYSVIYKTTVYYTYDANGNLLSTKKDGPTEVSRSMTGNAAAAPNKSLIASTLDGEVSRVSANVTFNTQKAQEVLSELNMERMRQGKEILSMNSSSESYKLACIKAADMATYGYCATESPMYGTLDDLIGRYGCSSENPSENIWKAGDKTASEIHSRLQSNDNSRMIRMSDYTEVGIAVIDVDGNTYYAEVFLR